MHRYALKNRPLAFVIFLFVLSGILACSIQTYDNDNDKHTEQDSAALQIYLVRHAEKELHIKNPPLSLSGKQRAIALMQILEEHSLDGIYSTDYLRTMETATPIAESRGLKIEHYNPRALADFADVLKAKSGIYLIVGHSNTTPQLVKLLGGDPVSEIDEAEEYDRLYHLSFSLNGKTHSQLLRYGIPYQHQN